MEPRRKKLYKSTIIFFTTLAVTRMMAEQAWCEWNETAEFDPNPTSCSFQCWYHSVWDLISLYTSGLWSCHTTSWEDGTVSRVFSWFWQILLLLLPMLRGNRKGLSIMLGDMKRSVSNYRRFHVDKQYRVSLLGSSPQRAFLAHLCCIRHRSFHVSRIRHRREEKLAQQLQSLYEVAAVSSITVSQIVAACSELQCCTKQLFATLTIAPGLREPWSDPNKADSADDGKSFKGWVWKLNVAF